MSNNNNWQDRRGMFQSGKVVHEPSGRKGSFAETGSVANAVRRASTSSNSSQDKPQSPVGGSFPTAGTGRRRSSAGQGGLFGNLSNMKRGSQDYSERRTSQNEQLGTGGGMVSGWFNSTFKGVQPQQQAQQKPVNTQQDKRGVME